VEANFTQSGADVSAGNQAMVLIDGVQDPNNPSLIDLVGLGGRCDNGTFGNASLQATISDVTQVAFTFTDAGSLGTAVTTGTGSFNANGTTIASATYTTPASCGFVADSGTITGTLLSPFSGTYSGYLNGGADAVIVTVMQNSSFMVSVSGTDNGTQFTLSGSVIGATFEVSGTIGGQAVSYVGVFDPTGNDFLVYANTNPIVFLGTLHAGSNPAASPQPPGLHN
jgi:hypothetical protein